MTLELSSCAAHRQIENKIRVITVRPAADAFLRKTRAFSSFLPFSIVHGQRAQSSGGQNLQSANYSVTITIFFLPETCESSGILVICMTLQCVFYWNCSDCTVHMRACLYRMMSYQSPIGISGLISQCTAALYQPQCFYGTDGLIRLCSWSPRRQFLAKLD